MQDQVSILGVDISKAKFDVCLIVENRQFNRIFKNNTDGFNSCLQWCLNKGTDTLHVCMEATGWYNEELADFMYTNQHHVSIVNPFRIKSHGQSKGLRHKTDKADAACIADFCKIHNPPLWSPMNPDQKRLRNVSRMVCSLKEERLVIKNKLENERLDQKVNQSLHILVKTFDEQITVLEKEMMKIIQTSSELKEAFQLLNNIKGVGILTTIALLTEMPNVNQFDSVRAYVAYAGLNPKQHQSGTSVLKKGRISKMGGARIRRALYLPAVVIKNHNENFNEFCKRLAARGKAAKVIIIAIMRKLLHIVYGILKHKQPFDAQKAFG